MSHDVQQVRSFEHPGEGRKRARSTPKGRQVDPTAAHEIELLLGERPRRRDLLVEHLHLIQDRYHQISAAHLAALADEMKLSFAEVFETATFYAHFDIVKEGEAGGAAPPARRREGAAPPPPSHKMTRWRPLSPRGGVGARHPRARGAFFRGNPGGGGGPR